MLRYKKKDQSRGNDMNRYLQQTKDIESPQQSSDVEVVAETDLKGLLKGEFQKIGIDVKSVEIRLHAIEDKLSSIETSVAALKVELSSVKHNVSLEKKT